MFTLIATRTSIAAALMIAIMSMLAAPAFADTGDSNYTTVREGRFVWHKPIALASKAVAADPSAKAVASVTYDKGDRGVYVRHTRTVSKVYAPAKSTAVASGRSVEAKRVNVSDTVRSKRYTR